MKFFPQTFLACLLFLSAFCASAQTDYYKEIKKTDLSKLWRSDSLFVVEHNYNDEHELLWTNPHMEGFPESLGFIDTNYQRFCIHYTSVTKSPADPYKYIITGKTMVKGNICPFKGTITIKKAQLLKQQEFPAFQRYVLYAEYKFNEENKSQHSGFFVGKLQTNFYINKEQVLFYDNIDVEADHYSNNQYTGTWTNYKKGGAKKCNWGDYRIPNSGPFDIGTLVFAVKDRYIKNGWQDYVTAHSAGEGATQLAAREKENEQWWKD